MWGLQPRTSKQGFETIKCRLTMKRARMTQSLAYTSGSSKTTSTLQHQMEDTCQGEALLESDKTMQPELVEETPLTLMQPMYDG